MRDASASERASYICASVKKKYFLWSIKIRQPRAMEIFVKSTSLPDVT